MRITHIIALIILLGLAHCCSAGTLSTTPDGSLQAISQGPNTISLYWRHEGRSADIYVNGQAYSKFIADPTGPYSCKSITNLQPNSFYTFSLGKSSPTITERTWAKLPSQASFDLLVLGGNASGLAAAVTGAKMGLNVALVESTNRLGGMSSNGLGSVDIRNVARSNGFFDKFRERVIEFYGGENGLRFEPRVANAILKNMAYEQPRICLYMKSEIIGAIRDGNRVCGAEVRDMVSNCTGKLYAKITIDATDCADFSAVCGVERRIGREHRTECEPHAGVIYFDNAKQEILPNSTGASDSKIQSYAYLMTWKDYGDKPAPKVEKPASYNSEDYTYSPEWQKTWNAMYGKLPNGKFEINQHPFGTDKPEINYDYPYANKNRRCDIDEIYRNRALGYLYFIQNERGHTNIGLADDEYLDSDNFPQSIYVREAGRIVGEHLSYECEVTNARQYFHADSIAIADYPMDSHAMEELKSPDGRIDKGEGEMWLMKFTPWSQVPYGVIVPKHVEGLLVTTAVSATHVAYGTLRMEPVRMSMGQAAAAAAYFAITRAMEIRCINPAWIQDKILSQHSYIYWHSDVTASTRHFKAINFLAARAIFGSEQFRPEADLTQNEAAEALNRLVEIENNALSFCKNASDTPITRGQFAQWLVEAKAKIDATWKPGAKKQSYEDVAANSPYFCAVETLHAHRIRPSLFANYTSGLFQPNAPISRADAAQAIYLAHRTFAMGY